MEEPLDQLINSKISTTDLGRLMLVVKGAELPTTASAVIRQFVLDGIKRHEAAKTKTHKPK